MESGDSRSPTVGLQTYWGSITMWGNNRMRGVVVRARQETAFRLARKSILALVGSAVLQITVGSAGIEESAAADASPQLLTVYPNQVFSTGKPGQLGLYIESEDWHVLVDMPGFEHQEVLFTAPSQFFFMRNKASETTASVFAERIDDADNSESCRRKYAPTTQEARDRMANLLRDKGTVSEVSEIEAHGNTLQMFEFTIPEFGPQKEIYRRKAIHWFSYYRGFCFHVHFDVSNAAAEQEVLKIVGSLAYVPQKPRKVDVDRLFYFDRLRIRLSIPIDWQYAYRRPPPGPLGGIELLPAWNQDFSFLVIPIGRIQPTASTPKDVAKRSRARLASIGAEVSVLNEACNGDTCLYSFDHSDPQCDKPSTLCFPYWRRIFATIGDQFLGLSAGYQGTAKGAADHIADALSRVKVLDLAEAHKGLTQGEGKTAE